MVFKHDVIIIGSGLAGLRAAVEASHKADVALISKVFPTRSLTFFLNCYAYLETNPFPPFTKGGLVGVK